MGGFGGLSARAKMWLSGVLLGLGSLVLFGWGIAQPAAIYFDETHYVPAARALLARSGGVNIEHPLFAKTLMGLSMALFGDNAIGWRMPSLVFGVGSVVALFRIAMLLFRDWRCAFCAGVLLAVNQTHFVQARIGMLDMVMTGCLLLGMACLMQGEQEGAGRRWSWAGAVWLGLAVGAKWLAVPYVVLALLACGWHRWRASGEDEAYLIDRVLPGVAKLGGVALLVYFATFWPAFFYTRGAMTWRHLLGFQFEMLAQQRMALAAHPYMSDWWSWPVMARPLWYLFEQTGPANLKTSYRAILLVGNPVIYWGGLGFVGLALSGWMKRRDFVLAACAGLWVFSLGIWVVIPKQIGFFYYYNLSAVWLCLVCVAFLRLFDRERLRLVWWFTALACVMFAYFYPVIAGSPLPPDDTWTQWMWFKGWM